MCLMKAKQLLQREDTDSIRLRPGPTGTIPQCYQGSVGLQLHSQPDSRRESMFWRPCCRLSLLWADGGLSFAGRELRHLCSVLAWIENSIRVAFFFSLTNLEPGTQKLTFHFLPRPLELGNDKIRNGSFSCFSTIRFECHWWINDEQKEGASLSNGLECPGFQENNPTPLTSPLAFNHWESRTDLPDKHYSSL